MDRAPKLDPRAALERARAKLSPGELMLLALSERRQVANDNAQRNTRKVVRS